MQFNLQPDYVLDRIELYEINALMKYSYYSSKENWEQARLIAYLQAQTHSQKKLKVEDIIKFPWEKETKHDTYISTEDINRLSDMAEKYEKLFADQKQ